MPKPSRLSPLLSMPLGLIKPRTYVHRYRDHSFMSVWLVHGMASLGAIVGLLVLTGSVETLVSMSGQAGVGFALAGVIYELGWLALAAVLQAWCASPDTSDRAYRSSLRSVLLLTPIIAGSFLLIMFLIRALDIGTASEGRVMLSVLLIAFIMLGLGWAILHALKPPVWAARCGWPLRCEGCGYSLAGMQVGHSCPECGKNASESQQSHVGPTGLFVLPSLRMRLGLQSRKFGAMLPRFTHERRHRRFRMRCLLIMVGLGVVLIQCVVLVHLLTDPGSASSWSGLNEPAVWIFGLYAGMLCTFFFAAVQCSLASLAAMVIKKRHAVVCHEIACQAASWLSPLVVIWALGTYFYMGYILWNVIDSYLLFNSARSAYHVPFIGTAFLLFQMLMLVWFVGSLTRAIRSGMYSNF